MNGAWLLAVAAWLASGPETQPQPLWRMAPVSLDLRAATDVGPKRSGSLCLPAGAIAWRDAKPDEADARAALAEGLRAGGLALVDPGNPFGETGAVDRAIRAELHGLRLSACVPPGGLGRMLNHSHAIKGDGVIAVGWRAFARGQADAAASGETCVAFSYWEERASLPRMVLVGLRAAGVRIAAALRGEPPSPPDERCARLQGAPLPAMTAG